MTATAEVVKHPAKWTPTILDVIGRQLGDVPAGARALDFFAGRGLGDLRQLRPDLAWTGLELEPEWAVQAPGTLAADATRMPLRTASVDLAVTSPCYGNRMADTYAGGGTCRACGGEGATERLATPAEVDAGCELGIAFDPCQRCKGAGTDVSRRMTYAVALGRTPTERSTAVMQWGGTYRAMHRLAYTEALRVLAPGALLVVNMSNHLRGRKVQHVVEWHVDSLAGLGFQLQRLIPVATPRMRMGANHDARVDAEHVIVLRRP